MFFLNFMNYLWSCCWFKDWWIIFYNWAWVWSIRWWILKNLVNSSKTLTFIIIFWFCDISIEKIIEFHYHSLSNLYYYFEMTIRTNWKTIPIWINSCKIIKDLKYFNMLERQYEEKSFPCIYICWEKKLFVQMIKLKDVF